MLTFVITMAVLGLFPVPLTAAVLSLLLGENLFKKAGFLVMLAASIVCAIAYGCSSAFIYIN